MEWKMNPNAVNQFSKGSKIYTEGEAVFSIGMIVKGRVLIHNEGAKIVAGSGSFLGINDLYHGKYLNTYTAADDLLLYVFPINSIEELDTILSVNKDYHGFMVASQYKMIYDLNQIYEGLSKLCNSMHGFLKEYYEKYCEIASRRGFKARQEKRITSLELLDSELELISDRINYYIECKNLPIDAVKLFYSYGNAITLYQVEDEVSVVNQQLEALRERLSDFVEMVECLVDDTDTCLFRMIAEMAISLDSPAGVSNEIMEMMDDIIGQVNKAETFADRTLGKKLKINRKKMEEIYHLLLSSNRKEDVSSETLLKYSEEDTQQALEEMKDSYEKLLTYAGIEGEQAESMKTAMQDFVHMKDKSSSDNSARLLRKRLADYHYAIYRSIFLRAYNEKKVPRIVDMFLKYGFTDERLLTNDQMLSVYFLKEDEEQNGCCNTYDMKTWLTMIYEGKKEPSKNEFDQDFTEMLLDMRRQNKLTEKEAQEWLSDNLKKLEYEIHNMFRYNNRTTNGQISSFVPMLHKEQWSNSIERLYVTNSKVNDVINNILSIDYSVFDREIIYSNSEKKIVKEYIVKRVYPDIILFPNVGTGGIMWQEISGKKRDTPGRFCLPIFTDINLGLLLTRILGRYRWELCRTIEGISWNDIQNKSLTSEYSDYLQFYRKNKELSEEKKEKIKLQIQKGKNSSREIFVIDYELWINYEAMGAVKLNKPVREIMATYCPFAKELREQLKLQPLFEEAMARFHRERQKKQREVEGRHRLLAKEGIAIPQELMDTLSYYRDL
jgi:CRP-like cAMP-binding protein